MFCSNMKNEGNISELFRLCFVVTCIVIVNISSSFAGLSCRYESEVTTCSPASSVSEHLAGRMQQSRSLFENERCRVSEVGLSDDADRSKLPPYEIGIYVRYDCGSSEKELTQKPQNRYTATARYEFSCALKQYKFFESGFDIHSDGTRSHWDSQGTSRPIPWQYLAVGNRDARLVLLFQVWCNR